MFPSITTFCYVREGGHLGQWGYSNSLNIPSALFLTYLVHVPITFPHLPIFLPSFSGQLTHQLTCLWRGPTWTQGECVLTVFSCNIKIPRHYSTQRSYPHGLAKAYHSQYLSPKNLLAICHLCEFAEFANWLPSFFEHNSAWTLKL